MPRRPGPRAEARHAGRSPQARQPGRLASKRKGAVRPVPYHHGDLRRALLEEVLRTIQDEGVDAVTLRGVGERLGVSRTALYRHFASKQALLGAVAGEGFRTLRAALVAGYEAGGRGRAGFNEMGLAYVRFAIRYPSYYRVMFGGFVRPEDLEKTVPAGASGGSGDPFQVLLDAIVEQQEQGLLRRDDPMALAVYIWAVVHGVAMLALDGMLKDDFGAEALIAYAHERLQTGIAAVSSR